MPQSNQARDNHYRAWALEPRNPNCWAHALQLPKPLHPPLEPWLHKRSYRNEKPPRWEPHRPQLEKRPHSNEQPEHPKRNKYIKLCLPISAHVFIHSIFIDINTNRRCLLYILAYNLILLYLVVQIVPALATVLLQVLGRKKNKTKKTKLSRGEDKFRVWDEQIHTTIYTVDKQQRPTI